jgi:hypothetical protein
MDYFAGLDVSVKETNVCIVDDTGKIVRETRVASEPEALLQVLTNRAESLGKRTTRIVYASNRGHPAACRAAYPRSGVSSCLTSVARYGGMGVAGASYWSFKHLPIADREIRLGCWSLSEECIL